jgi:hypothetical protein
MEMKNSQMDPQFFGRREMSAEALFFRFTGVVHTFGIAAESTAGKKVKAFFIVFLSGVTLPVRLTVTSTSYVPLNATSGALPQAQQFCSG